MAKDAEQLSWLSSSCQQADNKENDNNANW